MKCLVAIKRVIDPYVSIRVKSDGSGVEKNNVKMAMNPFDEIAVEAAVSLKEQGIVDELKVVSIGDNSCQETLRQGLARGADTALLIETSEILPAISIAQVLANLVKEDAADLVLLGKQAIDNDCNQVGQMLAGMLQWSQGTFVSNIELQAQASTVRVTREIDGGLETLELTLPAVITTDLRLNEPRYISLPNVMKAKKKPLVVKSLDELGIVIKQSQTIVSVSAPKARSAGVRLESVSELVDRLKNEAQVI